MITIRANGTTIVVNTQTNVINATRLLDGGIHLITMTCDGSVGDLGRKVDTATTLTNDMFLTFARIEKESKEELVEP